VAALTHPIGVGPGGWPNAHSLYVRTLVEHGVLGLASLALLIGALVTPLAHRAWQERRSEGLLSNAVLVAAIGGQLINGLVIDSIHWRHLWILLGLAWSALETQAVQEKR
jgi:O-antigen ligase